MVKRMHVKAFAQRLRCPQSEEGGVLAAVSQDRHIIRHRQDLLRILPGKRRFAVFLMPYDSAAKLHDHRILDLARLPGIAFFHPVIRHFHLFSVDDGLLKQAVAIPDPVAVTVHAEACHGIQKASRKSSETAVTESRILLLLAHVIQRLTHGFKPFSHDILNAEIDEVVAQKLADQKLQRKVDDLLILGCRPVFRLILDPSDIVHKELYQHVITFPRRAFFKLPAHLRKKLPPVHGHKFLFIVKNLFSVHA